MNPIEKALEEFDNKFYLTEGTIEEIFAVNLNEEVKSFFRKALTEVYEAGFEAGIEFYRTSGSAHSK